MALTIDNMTRRLGAHPALAGVSLAAEDGAFVALLGPSGAGKTTLLRVLAGLEAPDSGRVMLGGADFLALPPAERRVGLVFQHYALFRHLTVARNIAFALEVRPRRTRPSRPVIAERVRALLALTRIEGLGGRYPSQLSGGEAQRVAVARALAGEPQLLLLDEPFGALDAQVRHQLRGELRRIHDATGVTTLLVTHDQDEAMGLADRVAVMNAGRIEQIGRPQDLEAAPASAFVFQFLGEVNRLPCRTTDRIVRFEGFEADRIGPETLNRSGEGLFRPADTVLAAGEGTAGLPVRVVSLAQRGLIARLECETAAGARLIAEMTGPLDGLAPGAAARLTSRRAFVE